MLTIEEIREKMKDRDRKIISEKTGISKAILYRLKNGATLSMSYITIKKLSDYFEENQ